MGRVLQAAAEKLLHLAIRPESNLDNRASRFSAFREVAIPCRTDHYLLRQDCFIGVMCFTSIPAETDPSHRKSVFRERPWLDHWAHMGGLMYEAMPGLGLKWIRRPDETGYPERVLRTIERLRHTREPLHLWLSFVSFAHSYDKVHLPRAWAH